MNRAAWVLLLALFSCKQHKPVETIDSLTRKKLDSTKFATDLQRVSDSLDRKSQKLPDINDTIKPFTSEVYKKYIPDSILQLVATRLPEWKLPLPDSWERFWFKEYKKDTVLVNYISADFNGDGRKDYAFILNDAKREFATWVLQSKNGDYELIKLNSIKTVNGKTDMGLQIIPKGKLNYIDFDSDNDKYVMLKFPAIQVEFFEQSAETYYWQNGKYKSVTTGD